MKTIRQRLAIAGRRTNTNPTDAQKEIGNYAKGKITIQGLPISIENPKGSVRTGVSNGKAWRTVMPAAYGYIRGTTGADKDHVDVVIGPHPDSNLVFVIDQPNKHGGFDEHKVLLGFTNERDAVRTYLDGYPRGWKLGPVTQMTIGDFHRWLRHGSQTMRCCVQKFESRVRRTELSYDYDEKEIARQRADTDANFAKAGVARNVEKAGLVGAAAGAGLMLTKRFKRAGEIAAAAGAAAAAGGAIVHDVYDRRARKQWSLPTKTSTVTESHEDMNYKMGDTLKLIDRVKSKEPEQIRISAIKGGDSRDPEMGFTKERYRKTNTKYPIIVDENNNLMNGRHRKLKLMDQGRKVANIQRASPEDLEYARLR